MARIKTPADMAEELVAIAEALLREHWLNAGLDPDSMASLDELSEADQQIWLKRAEDQA